jgi:hypothetical protein
VPASVAEQNRTGLRSAFATLCRVLAPADHLALWTLTLDGAVAGSLMREGGEFRLSLFEAPDDDLAALEGTLSRRLGGDARLHAVAA